MINEQANRLSALEECLATVIKVPSQEFNNNITIILYMCECTVGVDVGDGTCFGTTYMIYRSPTILGRGQRDTLSSDRILPHHTADHPIESIHRPAFPCGFTNNGRSIDRSCHKP